MGVEIDVELCEISVAVPNSDKYKKFVKELENIDTFSEYFVNGELNDNTHDIQLDESQDFKESNDIVEIGDTIEDMLEVCSKYGYKMSLTLQVMSLDSNSYYYYYVVKNNRLYDVSSEINNLKHDAEKNYMDSFMSAK